MLCGPSTWTFILLVQQVFDVAVNQHTVRHGLDIYDKVGRGTAHDEYIPFKVDGNRLLIDNDALPFSNTLYVEFLKVFPKTLSSRLSATKPFHLCSLFDWTCYQGWQQDWTKNIVAEFKIPSLFVCLL